MELSDAKCESALKFSSTVCFVKDSRYFNLIRGEAESSQADYERYQSRRRKSRTEEAEKKRQRPTEEEQYDFFTKVRITREELPFRRPMDHFCYSQKIPSL